MYEVGNQVCLLSQLYHKTTGKRVQIAATHLKAGQNNNACSSMREHQVDELLHLLSETSYPVVLGGDFNAEPYTKAMKKVRKVYSLAYELSDPNLVTTCKIRGSETKKGAIDYLFFSNQLECTAIWDIPKKEMEEEKLPSLRYPSDHILIAAKFKFI
jgi:endonuclease/exonuclease/phosphatase family metal-dependent hydrolase